MDVWITRGLHPIVPGEPMSAHDTEAGAVAAACELVAMILADTALVDPPERVTPANWEDTLARLQDWHGAVNADVSVTRLTVMCRP